MASLGSVAKFSPTLLRVLPVALSAFAYVVNAPSGSTMARGSSMNTIFAASNIPGAKLVDVTLLHPTLVCTYDA